MTERRLTFIEARFQPGPDTNRWRRMLCSMLLACASTAFGADGLTSLRSPHAVMALRSALPWTG